jgi:hypothetical protein
MPEDRRILAHSEGLVEDGKSYYHSGLLCSTPGRTGVCGIQRAALMLGGHPMVASACLTKTQCYLLWAADAISGTCGGVKTSVYLWETLPKGRSLFLKLSAANIGVQFSCGTTPTLRRAFLFFRFCSVTTEHTFLRAG